MNVQKTFRRTRRTGVLAAASLFLVFPALQAAPKAEVAGAQTPGGKLDTVLRQMDAASAKFKSAEADVKQDIYDRAVKETTTTYGSIYFQRSGKGMEMGNWLAAKGDEKNPQIVQFANSTVKLYNTHQNQLTTIKAGSNQGLLQSFLTLGFGASGKDLEASWTLTDMGSEQLNDGNGPVTVEKIGLVAKDAGVQKQISGVTIWVDAARAIPLKQVFTLTSGDSRTTVYTKIRYNTKITMDPYKINTNKQTTYSNP